MTHILVRNEFPMRPSHFSVPSKHSLSPVRPAVTVCCCLQLSVVKLIKFIILIIIIVIGDSSCVLSCSYQSFKCLLFLFSFISIVLFGNRDKASINSISAALYINVKYNINVNNVIVLRPFKLLNLCIEPSHLISSHFLTYSTKGCGGLESIQY